MILIDHPNVLNAHCSFVDDHNLWVVMPYMAGGSCLHIMKSTHANGFNEIIIATVLRDVLLGLEYLHKHGHIHRDVKVIYIHLQDYMNNSIVYPIIFFYIVLYTHCNQGLINDLYEALMLHISHKVYAREFDI